MLNIRDNKGIYVFVALSFCATMAVLFFSANTPTTAQTSYRVRVSTPGYYYIKPSDISQNPQTAAITLTNDNVTEYVPGLQVVFKTEVANTNNANVDIQINRLGFENLLTRHGQEFRILEMDAGIMMTATYDGANFISDYVAARSLKGRLLATLNLPVGTHDNGVYFTWSVESGVSIVSAVDLPAGRFVNFQGTANVETADALLSLPNLRGARVAQLGWYLEVTNGSTVVYEETIAFGSALAFGSGITTTDGLVFNFGRYRAGDVDASIANPTFAVTTPYATDLTVAAGNDYQVKIYLSEN